MRKSKLLTGISLLLAISLTPVKAVSYSEFRDLPEYAWYEESITAALELGIIDGVDGYNFAPDDPIRSIDAAKAFYRMSGEPYWIDASYFWDVNPGYDSLAASYCIDTGIMSGYLDGSFRPDEWISRLDMLTMMYGWAIADHRQSLVQEAVVDQAQVIQDGNIPETGEPSETQNIVKEENSESQMAESVSTQTDSAIYAESEQPELDPGQTDHVGPSLMTEQSDSELSHVDPTAQQGAEPVESLSQVNEPAEDAQVQTESLTPTPDVSSQALSWAKANGLYNDQESFLLLEPVSRAQACELLVKGVSLPREQQAFDTAPQMDEPTVESEEQSWNDRLFGWLSPVVNDDPVNPGTGSEEDLMNASMYGIDISEHQGDIDLSPYQGQFVIIRAGWHTTEDLYFRKNVEKCEALGIPYGLYWYSYALDESQAQVEADAFARAIDGLNPTMGVWIDMETDSWKSEHGFVETTENISAITRTMTNRIEQMGIQPGIYCNLRWLPYFDESLAHYPKWVAAYGNDDGNIHGNYSDQAVMFQYTSNPIDKNVLYSTN